MSGVPVGEATARDFIMVRAALVERLGGANEALVWSRIYWRVGPDSSVAYEHDGDHWWAASLATIAKETGLTAKQVRTALDGLIEGGFIVREQHAGYDRTAAYRPVVHVPSGANGSAQTGTFDVPSRANVPLIEELETSLSKKKPERPLPNGWMPTAEHYAFAAKRGVDLQAEVDAFKSHAQVHDRRVANWNAAFTWWLKKSRPTVVRQAALELVPDVHVPAWVSALRIPVEEYLERRDEPGWAEAMEARAREAS